jgi:cell division septal protein FtsQ
VKYKFGAKGYKKKVKDKSQKVKMWSQFFRFFRLRERRMCGSMSFCLLPFAFCLLPFQTSSPTLQVDEVVFEGNKVFSSEELKRQLQLVGDDI